MSGAREKAVRDFAAYLKGIHDEAIREGMRMQRAGETEGPRMDFDQAARATIDGLTRSLGLVAVDPALVAAVREADAVADASRRNANAGDRTSPRADIAVHSMSLNRAIEGRLALADAVLEQLGAKP